MRFGVRRMKMKIEKLLDWLRRNLLFCKAVLFMLGLYTSYSIVDYAVMSILIDFLSETLDTTDLLRVAILRNLADALLFVSVIVMSHVSDVYTGLFSPITFCSTANVMGLMILWVSEASETGIGMHFTGVVLVAIGMAAKENPLLPRFLENQLRHMVEQSAVANSNGTSQLQSHDHEKNVEERIEVSSFIWLRISKICASLIVIFILGDKKWEYVFMCCSLIMGATFLVFISGSFWYCPETPTGTGPFSGIWRVLKAAITKSKVRRMNITGALRIIYHCNNFTRYLHHRSRTEQSRLHLLPRVPEAAVIEGPSQSHYHELTSLEMQERNRNEVKSPILTIPLWLTFMAYSLVQYAGNTFFVKQASTLKAADVGSIEVSAKHFFVLKSTIRDVILIIIRWKRLKGQRFTIKRTSAGMISASLCCFTSSLVEFIRLSLVEKEGKHSCDSDTEVFLSILVLIPQFFLLGLMEGLAEDGLQQFFENCVPSSLKRFGKIITEVVMAIGTLLNVLMGLIFRSWIKECINSSHLDRYYLMIGGLCSVAVFLFALFYTRSSFPFLEFHQDEEENNSVELSPVQAPQQAQVNGLSDPMQAAGYRVQQHMDTQQSFYQDGGGNPDLETKEDPQDSLVHDSSVEMPADSPVY